MNEEILEGIFVGSHKHALDSKRRVTIPSDWRSSVGSSKRVFILPGIEEKCLYIYTAQEMQQRLNRLRDLSVADEKGRKLIRQIASRAESVSWDKQGRIRISEDLLKHAEIEHEVILSGAFHRFELWNPEHFAVAREETGEGVSLADAARYVGF